MSPDLGVSSAERAHVEAQRSRLAAAESGLRVRPATVTLFRTGCIFGATTARELKSYGLELSYIAHHRNLIWLRQQFLHAVGKVSGVR
jgi:hypothetical protein